MYRIIVAIVLFLKISLAVASPVPADQAFNLSVYYNPDKQIVFKWNLAPSVYLYRDKISITPAAGNQIKLGQIVLPQGKPKHDQLHGQFQAYFGQLEIPLQLTSTQGVFAVNVKYQGCSTDGFCYAPVKKTLLVDLSKRTAAENLTPYVCNASVEMKSTPSEQDFVGKFFSGHNLFVIILSFLGLGLLLAFTPCTLPMVPILSGIIVGHGKKSLKRRAFSLSLAYVLGMAVTYAIVGVVIALIGSSIQAQLQKPWIIVLFSGIFILLAMSLFGFYELRLPSAWQRRVTEWSNRQKGGTYFGVFLMGSLSTLIISPCVSAPLVGVLAYIGQTGDVLVGALALLALGVGMGIPLLLIGISADKLLPKAGSWLTTVERLFGLLMLGVAIWMLSRMIPGPVTLFLWALLCGSAAAYLILFAIAPVNWKWAVKGSGVGALMYAIILTIGAVEGNSDPFHPWEQFNGIFAKTTTVENSLFTIIHSMPELDAQLASGRPVILDFYADWCTSCVVMNHTVFAKPNVRRALTPFVLLRADVTANNEFDQALAKRFHVVGPPMIIFFNAQGQELTSLRIVGEVDAKEFLMQLEKVQKNIN